MFSDCKQLGCYEVLMMPRTKISPYADRDFILHRMGFGSYFDYLGSDLWSGIRRTVLAKHKHKCFVCKNRAIEVHHRSYSEETLRVFSYSALVPLCVDCHKKIEFKGDKKRLFADVEYLLITLSKKNKKRQKGPKQKQIIKECLSCRCARLNMNRLAFGGRALYCKCSEREQTQSAQRTNGNHALGMERPIEQKPAGMAQ